jgi:hypothetical protein
MRAARPALLAVLCLDTSGCWFSHKAPPKISAPASAPQPLPQPVAAQPAPPPAVTVPEPVPLPVESGTPSPALSPVPAPPDTPAPKPAVRRNPAPPTNPPPSPAVTPATPVTPSPPLREIISGAQRRQYEAQFSQGVTRANAALKQASARALNAGQQETAARIRTFLAQASAMREDDISTALQLVRRADLLGQELLKSLR